MRNFFAWRGLIALGLLISTIGFAKGLTTLAPGAPGAADEGTGDTKVDDEKVSEAPEAPEAPEPDEPAEPGDVSATASAAASTSPYRLATSFGWAGLTKKSVPWHASGMSDITIFYKLPVRILGEFLSASFRYAPMAVAPMIRDGRENYSYVGTVEGFHFGGNLAVKVQDRVTACGSAELGFMKTTLKDVMGFPEHKVPADSGVNLTVGAGGDWQVVQGFDVGPRVYFGLGSFSTFQLGASGVFSF